MLVKEEIVKEWYKKESWVYKNFSYLFQNILWNKRVPKGFSICPYFWLSIFSLFIFKPLSILAFPFVFVVKKIIGLGKVWACILLTVVAVGMCYNLFMLGVLLWGFYVGTIMQNSVTLFWFWGSFLMILSLVFPLIYHHTTNKRKISGVNVKAPTYFCSSAILVYGFIFHTNQLTSIVSTILGFIWFLISYCFSFLAAGAWMVLTYDPFLIGIPLIIFMSVGVAVLGLVGWTLDNMLPNWINRFKSNYTEAWRKILHNSTKESIDWVNDHTNWEKYNLIVERAYNEIDGKVYIHVEDRLNDFIADDFLMIHFGWHRKLGNIEIPKCKGAIENYNLEDLKYQLNQSTIDSLNINLKTFETSFVKKECEEILSEAYINLIITKLKSENEEAKKLLQPSKATLFWRKIWKGVRFAFLGVAKNIRVFFSYMGLLIKSKKEGVCPYFQFTNAPCETKGEEIRKEKT